MNRILSLFAVLLLVSSCAKTTSVRLNPLCSKVLHEKKDVLIIPPEVSVKMTGIGSNGNPMYGYQDHIENVLVKKLKKSIKKLGFKVSVLSRKNIHDRKLFDRVAALREAYNVAQKELYQKELEDEKIALAIDTNLGKPAIDLGKETNSSILFLTDYAKSVKTNQSRALELGVGLLFGRFQDSPADSSIIITGIIDGENGNILWTNRRNYIRGSLLSAIDNISSQEKIENKEIDDLITDALTSLYDIKTSKANAIN